MRIGRGSITAEGVDLPQNEHIEIDFTPSGGHDTEVHTTSDKSVTVLFVDNGWTRQDIALEITGSDLHVRIKKMSGGRYPFISQGTREAVAKALSLVKE